MRISLTTFASAALAAAMLAGCSLNTAPQVPVVAAGGAGQAARVAHVPPPDASMAKLTTREGISPKIRPSTQKSWMNPDAKNTKYLLYVSDEAAGRVDVYAYKSKAGKLLGQLTGFKFPYGQCLDATGNVYVTDFYAGNVVEYAHGGTQPLRSITDTYGYPIGCSVDPTTGNLAVANFEGVGSTCMGGIVIYQNATGSGTLYQDSDFNYYWPPGYDANGNLYVQGRKKETSKGKTGIAYIPAGGSQLTTMTLSGGSIAFPGGMQWDGHYITATDQAYQGGTLSGVYRLSATGASANFVGSTELDDECLKGSVAHNDVVQPWINGTARPNHAVVAGNLACDYRYNFWNYIRGGTPKRNLPYDISPQLASGQTVSPMKQK